MSQNNAPQKQKSEVARDAYQTGVHQQRENLRQCDKQGIILAHLRTLAFITFATCVLLVIFERLPMTGLFVALASIGAYVGLAIVHARVLHIEALSRVLLTLNERGLARLDGTWRTFRETGLEWLPENDAYAMDLNVLGHGSLFQRLDDTGTQTGAQQLATWLLRPAANAAIVHARQEAMRELAPKLRFRQALIAEARLAGQDKIDPTPFIAWAEGPSRMDAIRFLRPIALVLPMTTITLGLLAVYDVLSALPFGIGLGLQACIVFAIRKVLKPTWEALMLSEQRGLRFEKTFNAIAAESFSSPLLQTLQNRLPTPSGQFKIFARLVSFAELRLSAQLHAIINLLTLWDLSVLFCINTWRSKHGCHVREWFHALAQFEALASCASWPFERPEDVFPEVDDNPIHLESTALGHPLLDAPITNNVCLVGPGHAWVITGSNMSGKTTLLRAVGLNTVMSLAGLPVCARSFCTSITQVMTSMRLQDSLEQGTSYFYAEAQRMKQLLEMTANHPQRCLFLLDELFMGTNAKERQIASQRLLALLIDSGASGMVTTHDLSLCELASERINHVKNMHFRDEISKNDMTFDYRLREGVVQSTNALEVLRRVGIPL